jgi:hypothetical protein
MSGGVDSSLITALLFALVSDLSGDRGVHALVQLHHLRTRAAASVFSNLRAWYARHRNRGRKDGRLLVRAVGGPAINPPPLPLFFSFVDIPGADMLHAIAVVNTIAFMSFMRLLLERALR